METKERELGEEDSKLELYREESEHVQGTHASQHPPLI